MTASVIEMRGASKTYAGPPAVNALRPHDLRVARGEHVAVVGPSGSGKSTWLNLVGLLDRPTEGEYILDGEPTSALRDERRAALRAARVGFVFQAFHVLPSRTAVKNVMLGLLRGAVLDRLGRGGTIRAPRR